VHTQGPSGSQHSHASLNLPLVLAPNPSHLLRAGPTEPIQITAVTRPAPGIARVMVGNQGPDDTVSIAAEIVPETRSYDWLQREFQPRSETTDVPIAGRATQAIDVPVGAGCGPDTALVRLRLYSMTQPAGVPADDVLVDTCA